jgi:hypothetical protein
MPIDPLSAISISISLVSAIGTVVMGLHLKRCHSICCDSDCVQPKTPPPTPMLINEPPIRQQQQQQTIII